MNIALLILGILIGMGVSKYYETVIYNKNMDILMNDPEVLKIRSEIAALKMREMYDGISDYE